MSWADLIAVAGAEAVALCGGPEIPVRLGRLDSRCNMVACSFYNFLTVVTKLKAIPEVFLFSTYPHSSEIIVWHVALLILLVNFLKKHWILLP